MILSIAWKNIWRNKVRSLVVIMAICFGLLGGIVAVAFMNGLLLGRLNDAIKIEVSSLQLHKVEYLENNEIRYVIKNADKLMDDVRDYPGVEAVSKRFKMEVMVSSNRSAAGSMLLAVQPENEKNVSELYKHLVDSTSRYFEGIRRNPILIGRKMAEKLKVHVRSKLMINTVDINGESIQPVFRVAGIFRTQNTGFDESNVFIRYEDAVRIFGFSNDESHEIAVLMEDMIETNDITLALKKKYTRFRIDDKALLRARNDSIPTTVYEKLKSVKSDKEYSYDEFNMEMKKILKPDDYTNYLKQIQTVAETGIDVSEWKSLSPELAMQSTWLDFMMFIFVGIILLALGFGIVNTMLMVVLERVREIGMLIAIGMNRKRVFTMIMYETVFLSLTGGVAGIVLSWITVTVLNHNGIDFSSISEGLQAIGYPSIIYPTVDFSGYVQVAVMVVITGILASVYPAWHAIRLKPAEAIRSE
jgi:ABC-type lipoprotein release transport system permease subunit